MDARLGVAVLGPFTVSRGGEDVAIAGTTRQALLALLALAAPRPVSDGRLIDELWGEEPPGNPANALQAQVSHLRRILGAESLVRVGSGYGLAVEPGAVDATCLERLVAEGRAAAEEGDERRAAARFRTAVGLVRGPPLAELVDHRFARDESVRLGELVLDAQEGLVDAELASGRHAEVVAWLTDLVRDHPLRERFHAQLILALYRCGRQADALCAYQAVRGVLLDELGVDPGPELQALEQAVLGHDPVLLAPLLAAAPRAVPSLPVPVSTFVGRVDESAVLLEAIDSSRLVTLVGVGGMGKTRLALDVAHRLAEDREVWFVELAPVTDPIAVPEALATALGATDQASADDPGSVRSPDQRAVERIGGRDVVLVLDNCEHVLEAVAGSVRTLLRGCPRLRVVATSREVLGLVGEQQVVLEPMAIEDAVRLFTDRARSVRPRFAESGDDSSTLVELCRRLDQLPLALELAAARTKTLAVTEITERLDDRFEFLQAGGGRGEGGHAGLGAALDWSYDSLFEEERLTFCLLGAFAGGATIDALDVVAGREAVDLVARLVDKSLVVADASGQSTRYRMLESVRAYALDRLRDDGRLDQARAAHLAWCVALAEEAEPHIRGHDQLDWLSRLDAEHDNLRAALAHAVTAEPGGALRLIGALILAWYFRGRHQEARHWVEAGLTAGADAPAAARAKVLAWSGLLADASTWTERPGGIETELLLAEARAREAIALLSGPDDDGDGHELVVAEAHRMLVLAVVRQGTVGLAVDTEELAQLFPATIDRFTRLDDAYGLAIVGALWSVSSLAAGDLDEAVRLCEMARFHADRSGDRFSQSRVAWLSGLIAEVTADPTTAYHHIERGIRLLAELGMEQHVTAQAELLVRLADLGDEPERAEQWRAFVAGRGGGGVNRDDLVTAALARNADGIAARGEGRLDAARASHLEARDWYADAGVAAGLAFTESSLGFLAGAAGDLATARAHHSAALAAAVDAGESGALALALEGVASVAAGESGALALALEGVASVAAGERADPVRAATLLGGAAAQWDRAAGHREGVHDADVLIASDRLRATVGSDGFARAFALGQACDRHELIALARGPWGSMP